MDGDMIEDLLSGINSTLIDISGQLSNIERCIKDIPTSDYTYETCQKLNEINDNINSIKGKL